MWKIIKTVTTSLAVNNKLNVSKFIINQVDRHTYMTNQIFRGNKDP